MRHELPDDRAQVGRLSAATGTESPFHLTRCEMSFRFDGLTMFQLRIARDIASLPLMRSGTATVEESLRCAPTTRQRQADRNAPGSRNETAAQC
jgi:hypothetical protein